ncbi:Zn-ribbon domain-containing OB-fold protein [Thalassotalea sp. Y01]|uniref:Zn-ribbon domain-containing OB-fold protein n=1 Tax=Thalassotalea sp. Y01 TaxID=2729613 RepID=UPI00145FB68D|nr:Zn-ribbon domain-containing OB-fold protein [Thalassotalea sp. Y01]NMP16863.1 Zn-ribbon domain-containing OB-fold protein [Thalassotalea sp. Y01]
MTELKRPLPNISKESQGFWDAVQQDKLVIQHCNSCDSNIFYPRRICPHCWSKDLGWVEASGKGTIFSVTTTYLGTTAEFSDELPITVAWIDLDEGVRMASNIVGCGPEQAKIGDRVEVVFEKANEDFKLPFFKIVEA